MVVAYCNAMSLGGVAKCYIFIFVTFEITAFSRQTTGVILGLN